MNINYIYMFYRCFLFSLFRALDQTLVEQAAAFQANHHLALGLEVGILFVINEKMLTIME